jgi:hypothetical protein
MMSSLQAGIVRGRAEAITGQGHGADDDQDVDDADRGDDGPTQWDRADDVTTGEAT